MLETLESLDKRCSSQQPEFAACATKFDAADQKVTLFSDLIANETSSWSTELSRQVLIVGWLDDIVEVPIPRPPILQLDGSGPPGSR